MVLSLYLMFIQRIVCITKVCVGVWPVTAGEWLPTLVFGMNSDLQEQIPSELRLRPTFQRCLLWIHLSYPISLYKVFTLVINTCMFSNDTLSLFVSSLFDCHLNAKWHNMYIQSMLCNKNFSRRKSKCNLHGNLSTCPSFSTSHFLHVWQREAEDFCLNTIHTHISAHQ